MKILLLESEILDFGIWNTAQGIRTPRLGSKHFQSSYCAKARAEAIKKGGPFSPLPLPRHSFFCSLPNFLDELAETLATQATRIQDCLWGDIL